MLEGEEGQNGKNACVALLGSTGRERKWARLLVMGREQMLWIFLSNVCTLPSFASTAHSFCFVSKFIWALSFFSFSFSLTQEKNIYAKLC